jgi:6-phosphogluconolactonase
MSEPEIIVVDDADAAAAVASDRIAATLRSAVDARGQAHWATTGGSTVVGIYRALTTSAMHVPWPAVHVWWGDERYVPRDHALSNVKPFDDILLDLSGREEGTALGSAAAVVPLAVANIHPFPTSEAIGGSWGAAECAAVLEQELREEALPQADGWPVFDLLLLGVGADGHVLSVFPSSEAFRSDAWALAIPAPTHIEPHVERVTLNPAIARVAERIVVVMLGAAKAAIVGDIFGSESDPPRLPAQLARREGATWILDKAAAANLPGH